MWSGEKSQNLITVHLLGVVKQDVFDPKKNFSALRAMLARVLEREPVKDHNFLDEMADPAFQPMIWVSKWVDYSDKSGFGYQLCDESVGVMFKDRTQLIRLPNKINVHYSDENGEKSYVTVEDYPGNLDRKMRWLSYCSQYMRERLITTGPSVVREVNSISRTPQLQLWCRDTSGVLMQLDNGTVQMNFRDHTKIIMCPSMEAITYIDKEKQFRTYPISTLEDNGCNVTLHKKMRHVYDKIAVLLNLENGRYFLIH